MIREGWIDSHKIDALDANAERFFLRLCLKADDFGRFHGSPQALRTMLFPLKEDMRSADIPRLLQQCEQAGLVRCYVIDGRNYVEIENFDQRLRAKNSKFPPPPDTCPTHARHMPGICPTDDGLREEKRREENGREREHEPEPVEGLTTSGASRMAEIQTRINECHPNWLKRPTFTYQELLELKENFKFFDSLKDADWKLLAEYQDALIDPKLGKFWQPDSRAMFIKSISDVCSLAEKWRSLV